MPIKSVFLTAFLFLYFHFSSQAQIITTIAGNNSYGFSGIGGPATSAHIGETYGIVVDNAGNTYFADADNNVIWKVNGAGILSIYAGVGGPSTIGYSGDGGPATAALLYHPAWMSIDNGGNIYFVDQNGDYIRKIDPAGIITTYAGGYSPAGGGDGGPVSAATFFSLSAVVADNAGNIYITDNGADVIRKVNPAGIISTIAGIAGVAGFSGDGGPATAAKLNSPYGVAVDAAGNIYIPDAGNNRIRKINSAGVITTIAGGIPGYAGDGGPAIAAALHFPWAVIVDPGGNLFINDGLNSVVRKIANTGTISTYAGDGIPGYSGDGGPATAAELGGPSGLAIDNAGNLYITDNVNYAVRKVTNCVLPIIGSQPANDNICDGGNASFMVAAMGATGYQWQVNTGSSWTNLSDNAIYSGSGTPVLTITAATILMNSYQYRCSISDACGFILSSAVNLSVKAFSSPGVAIAPASGVVCGGAPAVFTAIPVNGGTTPSYQWQVNGINMGTNSSSFTDNSPGAGDVINVILTSNATCLTTATASISTPLTVMAAVTPGLSIAAPSSEICAGAPVSFTATPVNGGAFPFYQWRLNGGITSANGPVYTDAAPANGDVVSCTLFSSAACATSISAVSNPVSLTVDPLLTPGLTISAPVTSVCFGTPVLFTAAPVNGGASPSFQWQVNGQNAGTNSSQYSAGGLNNGDIVSCILSGNAVCATSPTAISNSIPVTVAPLLTPTVNILSTATDICIGTPVVFSAVSANGGPTPVYQWQINGIDAGTNSFSFTAPNLGNGDVIECFLTSDATCLATPSAASNTIVEKVEALVQASVSIAASSVTICSGTDVTFTASPTNGGSSPVYQWQVNGSNTGAGGARFAIKTLKDGDVVSCILVSSLACSSPVASLNAITVTVNPNPVLTLMRDTIIALGTSLPLTESVTGTIIGFEWQPATSLDYPSVPSPIASPLVTTVYQLTVTTDAGCTASGKVTIGVFKELLMPNAFTPNGDGKNDVFRIPPSISVKVNSFTIYDRWGMRVFETKDSGAGWDGTIGGRPEPAGGYVWQIEYQDLLTKKPVRVSGMVILVR